MACSLMDRCHEVKDFLQRAKEEKIWLSGALLQATSDEKLEYAVRYLESELRIHQEVRTLWPYLLALADSEETELFCQMYGCELEQLGDIVQTRICQLQNSLEVIDCKLVQDASPSSFWRQMRNQLLQKICMEAEKTLTETKP